MFHSIGTRYEDTECLTPRARERLENLFTNLESTLRDKCMAHFLKQIRVPSNKFDLGVWVSLKKENASILYDGNHFYFQYLLALILPLSSSDQ
jgi:hypothetical protein